MATPADGVREPAVLRVETLVLRRCAYWRSLRGLPPADTETRKTVHVPRSQRFEPQTLDTLTATIIGTVGVTVPMRLFG